MSNANYKPENHHKVLLLLWRFSPSIILQTPQPPKAKLNSQDAVEKA